MEILEFLQKLRTLMGSVEKAAREIGCSRQAYENWLRGLEPSDMSVQAIRAAYKKYKDKI